ncbi:unnamed protein product, partial [Ixodes hexagonus]
VAVPASLPAAPVPLAPTLRPARPVYRAAQPVVQMPPVPPRQVPPSGPLTAPVMAAPVGYVAAAPAPTVPPPPAAGPATVALVAPRRVQVQDPLEGVPEGSQLSNLGFPSPTAGRAAQTFKSLFDRALRDRDVSGRLVSFQYTLCGLVALIIVVTIVGVILLQHAVAKQRARTASTAKHRFPRLADWERPTGPMAREEEKSTPEDSVPEVLEPTIVPPSALMPQLRDDAGTLRDPLLETTTDDGDAPTDD